MRPHLKKGKNTIEQHQWPHRPLPSIKTLLSPNSTTKTPTTILQSPLHLPSYNSIASKVSFSILAFYVCFLTQWIQLQWDNFWSHRKFIFLLQKSIYCSWRPWFHDYRNFFLNLWRVVTSWYFIFLNSWTHSSISYILER